MDFQFDPAVWKHTSLVVTAFQTTGTLLIALVLRQLTRGIPGQFLHYWSRAWVALAVALVALSVSFMSGPVFTPQPGLWVQRLALGTYAVCGYLFGFYLWAGCRAYATGAPLRGPDWLLFTPPAAFGLAAPVFLADINLLFPFHAAIFGMFGLLAFRATLGCRPDARQTVVGLRLTQVALLALTLLFWHYALVMGWVLVQRPQPDLGYLHFSALYDALVEILLGFGLVVLGIDSVRQELAAKNAALAETNWRLAQATEQLTRAVRTDPLTGLLNRRALEDILADRTGGPFAGSVAVVDLNGLKQLNDRHGHAAGDAAIQHVARALRTQFRVTDPLFRLGGDEFLVILEGGQSVDLAARLAAVDAALRGLRLPGVPEPVDVVIAWGMADFPTHADFAVAHATADAAMYVCKEQRKVGDALRSASQLI
jgi:diguanylate cyclase